MSKYERRAWDTCIDGVYKPPKSFPIPARARELVGSAAKGAGDLADEHLPTKKVKDILERTLDGTLELTFKPALRSADATKVLREHRKVHEGLGSLDDLRSLDLQHLDSFRRRKGRYTLASAVQGAGTSLVVTGAEVASTVSAGATAGAVISAVAADTVASLAMMGRSVGTVAARYGYDVRLPEEELFAMGVMSFGMAKSLEAKHVALAALSNLTQKMMRHAPWAELNKHVLVKVVKLVYERLGLNLTKRKLAQTVPFIGVGLNATLSASMTREVYQRAEDVYRLRFLAEKYDLDPSLWLREGLATEPASSDQAEQLDVVALLEEERSPEA